MYELTTQQENIWNLQSFYEDTTVSNISGILKFHTQLNMEYLKEAVNGYVEAQEGARLRFVKKENTIQQYVEAYEPFDIPVKRFESLEEMEAFAGREAQVPYCFGKAGEVSDRMYRFTIYQTDDACGVITHMNHMIADAWTLSLFCKTVIENYRMLEGKKQGLPHTFSYVDYIKKEQAYHASDKYKKDEAYWMSRFRETPVCKKIRPESKGGAKIASFRLTQKLSVKCAERLRAFCRKYGYSPAVLFESVICTYLNRINPPGKETVIGVPVLNRTGREKQIAGMFISTMPLGVEIEPKDRMLDVCQKVSVSHFELFRHQRFPYSEILKYVRRSHGFEGNLYDVMVSYQNAVVGEKEEMEYETEWLSNGYSEISMVFHIDDRDESGGFTIHMDVQEKLFTDGEAKLLFNRILFMADTLAEKEDIMADKMPIMPEEEYELTVHRFNETKAEYPHKMCVHTLFTEHADRHPDHVAAVFEGISYTYRQIDEMSDSLAYVLRERGVVRNTIIPVVAHRSHLVMVAILGILKAGGAYMPLDPAYPKERMEYIFEQSGSKLALVLGMEDGQLPENCEYIHLENVEYSKNCKRAENRNQAEDLCYVIFTSGSTGKPKGVGIPHRCVVNLAQNCKNILTDSSRVLIHTTFTFDVSIGEMLATLLNGGSCYFAGDGEANNAKLLAGAMETYHINCIFSTPTKYKILLNDEKFRRAFRNIQIVIAGGEILSSSFLNELWLHTAARVYNIYGPTETTVYSTQKRLECVRGDCQTDISIGSPIANTQIYILGKSGEIAPVGVAGELCIAGDGVGKGYLNQPELTAEKFVLNPFATEENGHGKTMYRTGDLARWRADGEIDFLGRIDTQVKIRGLRIELGEIENVLAGFEGIECCAVADKKDENGRQFLVGYYTASFTLDERSIRQHLSQKLPAYMVPNYFVHLEKMPMTDSGKTDRKKLPMPDLSDRRITYIAPATNMEKQICSLFEEILGIEKAGREENFFELGGDSYAAMTLAAKLSDLFGEVPLQQIFEKPSVKELGEWLEMQTGDGGQKKTSQEESQTVVCVKDNGKYSRYQEFLQKMKFLPDIDKEGKQLKTKNEGMGKQGILLTGATGFLGAHILEELLRQKDADIEVYCLIRGANEVAAKERLYCVMEAYFGKDNAALLQDREILHVIACDVTDCPAEAVRQVLRQYPSELTQIIHTAALVKHYGAYDTFYHINVEGTKRMLDVAKEFRAEFVHISAESVGGLYVERENAADSKKSHVKYFTERDIYIGQNLDNVYIRSKFEAECAVVDYIMAGGLAHVIRVGNLTNRYADGRFQINYRENAFLRRMDAFLSLGAYPKDFAGEPVDFSPVDETARAIVALAMKDTHRVKPGIFHVSHSNVMTYGSLAQKLNCLGVPMRAVSDKEFLSELRTGNISHDSVKNDLREVKKRSEYIPVVPVNANTAEYLAEIGFIWSEIDEKYLWQYLKYRETLKL